MGILLTPENVLMLCNGSKERALINQRTLYHKVTVGILKVPCKL